MADHFEDQVLIVDADRSAALLLQQVFRRDGLQSLHLTNATDVFTRLALHRVDLIVLGVSEPGTHVMDVLRRLRADAETFAIPIVILAASEDEADRLVRLELGADEYFTKPFNAREVLLRIRAILRRSHATAARPHEPICRVGDLVIDPERHDITLDGRSVFFTAAEFRILHRLSNDPGHVLSRETLGAAINANYGSLERTIDVHIKSIRRKLGPTGVGLIQTIRGFGYLLRDGAVLAVLPQAAWAAQPAQPRCDPVLL